MENDKKESNNTGVVVDVVREGYEGSVMARMEGRAGAYSPKGAAGNALEVMANDMENLSHIFEKDTVTKLTKSSTATQVDAVTMKAGKVVERIQYKDTVSPSGVKKTLDQVKSGKYQQAQLRGSIEATEKFNAAAEASGVSKRMTSTGISHDTAQRVADNFTHQPIKVASLTDAVKSSAGVAVGITSAIEIGKSIASGDSLGECTSHVVSKGAESAVSATTSAVVGGVTTSTVGTMLASQGITDLIVTGASTVAGIGAAVIAGGVVGEIVNGAFDDIASGVGEIVDDVAYEATEVIDNTLIGTAETIDDIARGVGNVASDVGSTVESVVVNAAGTVDDIIDGIGDVVSDVGTTVEIAATEIGIGIQCAVDAVVDIIGSLFNW